MSDTRTRWILELVDQVTGPAREMTNGMKGATATVQELNDHIGTLQTRASSLQSGLLKLGVAGAAFGLMTFQALSFNEGFAEINTTAQLNQEGIADLRSDIIGLAADSATALDKVPGAFARILDQVNDTDLSLDILGVALKGADAGFTDVDTVAAALAQTLSIVGKEATNANEVMDTLFAAKREGAGEFADFARYIPNLISSGKALGVGFKEAAGLFGYMTGKGFSAERSAVLLENAFSALGKSEIRDALSGFGVEIFDEATGSMRSMLDIITDLEGVMGGMSDQGKAEFLEGVGLRDKEARSALNALTSDMTKLNEVMGATANAEGSMAKAFEDAQNPLMAWNRGVNQVKIASIELFTGMEPLVGVLGKVVGGIASAVLWLVRLNPTVTSAVVIVTALIGTMAGVAMVIALVSVRLRMFQLQLLRASMASNGLSGSLARASLSMWGFIKNLFTGGVSLRFAGDMATRLRNRLLGTTAAATGAGGAMTFMSAMADIATFSMMSMGVAMQALTRTIFGIPIIGWILAVVAAVIALGVAIYRNWDEIVAFFYGVGAVFAAIGEKIGEVFTGIANASMWAWNTLVDYATRKLGELRAWAAQVWNDMVGGVRDFGTAAYVSVVAVFQRIGAAIGRVFSSIRTALKPMFDTIRGWVAELMEFLAPVIKVMERIAAIYRGGRDAKLASAKKKAEKGGSKPFDATAGLATSNSDTTGGADPVKPKATLEGSGGGSGKSITMTLDIKNYFNVATGVDINAIADQIVRKVNDRLRDAVVAVG